MLSSLEISGTYLQVWFYSFTIPFTHPRKYFFDGDHYYPIALLWCVVLAMAAFGMRIPWSPFICLPQPQLWVLELWPVARHLVETHQRRRATTTTEWMIEKWTPATSRSF